MLGMSLKVQLRGIERTLIKTRRSTHSRTGSGPAVSPPVMNTDGRAASSTA